MFKIMDYWQGKGIIAAIILLLFAWSQSYDANKYINKVNEENSSDYRKRKIETAPIVTLVISIIILVFCLILPMQLLDAE